MLLAPFLYIMPELDSYYCAHSLLADHIPTYVKKNLDGVYRGIKLVSRVLYILDIGLYKYILSKIPDLSIFSLRYILTLMANVQPLDEVVRLWDGLLAFGLHLASVTFCCYLISMRKDILAESSGYK